MSILDMFKSEKKNALCKKLLLSFISSPDTTSDPVIIHTVFDLVRSLRPCKSSYCQTSVALFKTFCFGCVIVKARNLHDSIDALTFSDERQQISDLVCRFVEKIDFGRDLEQQLHVYVDCRAAFPNFDNVNEKLVNVTACLAMRAHALVKGKHTRKTASFVKACLAYCHITIPSIQGASCCLVMCLHLVVYSGWSWYFRCRH